MILINGNFLCRNLTGIERYAFEVLKILDELISPSDDIRLLVPKNARIIPEFKQIKTILSAKSIKSFPRWDLLYFSKECKRNHATGLNFSNTAPFGKNCGIAFLHDIYAKDFPNDFTSKKDKLIKLYCRMNNWNIAKNAEKIITVSEFAKQRIMSTYNVKEERISVIPNGWEHIKAVTEDAGIFNRFSELKSKEFYFTLGSLSKRKNLKWIADYAEKHTEDVFAVSGKAISGLVAPELEKLKELKNVVLLGYVSDAEVKALMKACKALVFPSYYEGFGIPPLEALSVGTPVVIAREACLPEIYGKAAHYLDIKDTDRSLTSILAEPAEPSAAVLEKYTYRHAAEKLYGVLKEQEAKHNA